MNVPHLDDEALSAALDGEATAAEQDHLATCAHCRARCDDLAAVARIVAGPVAGPRPDVVEAAVRRALEESDRAASNAAASGGAGPATGPPFEPALAPVSVPPSRLGASRPAPRWLLPVAGIAAAVVIVGLLGIVLSRSSRHTSAATSAPTVAARAATKGASTTGVPITTVTIAPAARAASGNLGNQTDPAVVAQIVRGALQAPAPAAGASPAASASAVPATSPCVAEARRAVGVPAGASAVARYTAVLVWRGVPAVVVVFSPSGGLAGVIMKTAGCSVLAVLPF
jgi:hypothetical protein